MHPPLVLLPLLLLLLPMLECQVFGDTNDAFDHNEVDVATGRSFYHQIPTTNFRCENQQWAGYYSDTEAQCQVFHICVRRHGTLEQFSFLCPNETVFHQELLVCVWWDSYDCETSSQFYEINKSIFEEEESSPMGSPERTGKSLGLTTPVNSPIINLTPLDKNAGRSLPVNLSSRQGNSRVLDTNIGADVNFANNGKFIIKNNKKGFVDQTTTNTTPKTKENAFKKVSNLGKSIVSKIYNPNKTLPHNKSSLSETNRSLNSFTDRTNETKLKSNDQNLNRKKVQSIKNSLASIVAQTTTKSIPRKELETWTQPTLAQTSSFRNKTPLSRQTSTTFTSKPKNKATSKTLSRTTLTTLTTTTARPNFTTRIKATQTTTVKQPTQAKRIQTSSTTKATTKPTPTTKSKTRFNSQARRFNGQTRTLQKSTPQVLSIETTTFIPETTTSLFPITIATGLPLPLVRVKPVAKPAVNAKIKTNKNIRKPISSRAKPKPRHFNLGTQQSALDILHDLVKNITIIQSKELLKKHSKQTSKRTNVKRKVDHEAYHHQPLASYTSSRGVQRNIYATQSYKDKSPKIRKSFEAERKSHLVKERVTQNKQDSAKQNSAKQILNPALIQNSRINKSSSLGNANTEKLVNCEYYYGSNKRPNCNKVNERARKLQKLGLTSFPVDSKNFESTGVPLNQESIRLSKTINSYLNSSYNSNSTDDSKTLGAVSQSSNLYNKKSTSGLYTSKPSSKLNNNKSSTDLYNSSLKSKVNQIFTVPSHGLALSLPNQSANETSTPTSKENIDKITAVNDRNKTKINVDAITNKAKRKVSTKTNLQNYYALIPIGSSVVPATGFRKKRKTDSEPHQRLAFEQNHDKVMMIMNKPAHPLPIRSQ